MLRGTLGSASLQAFRVPELVLSRDALAYYVGQDTLLKILLSEEQASSTPSLVNVQRLQRHRRHVQQQLNLLRSVALQEAGVDTSKVHRAALTATLDPAGDEAVVHVSIEFDVAGGGG